MMRSLYSGVAGLRTHQTKMDVIGNNIANVNTTSFKSQSITFSDLMYQTTQTASGATETKGGVNARQIGLGAKSGAIATAIEGQGATQTTNNPFDIMITGKAFFIVNNGKENLYTRDGSFYVDGAGNLAMQSNGYFVQGWVAQEDKETGEITVNKNGGLSPLQIMSAENSTYSPASTTAALYSGNIDDHDTNVVSDDGKTITLEFYDNKGYLYTGKFVLKDTGTDHLFSLQLTDIIDSEGNTINRTLADGKTVLDHITFGDTESTEPLESLDTHEVVVDETTNVATVNELAGATAYSNVPLEGTLADIMESSKKTYSGVLKGAYGISDDDVDAAEYDRTATYKIDSSTGKLTISYTCTDKEYSRGTAYGYQTTPSDTYYYDSNTGRGYKALSSTMSKAKLDNLSEYDKTTMQEVYGVTADANHLYTSNGSTLTVSTISSLAEKEDATSIAASTLAGYSDEFSGTGSYTNTLATALTASGETDVYYTFDGTNIAVNKIKTTMTGDTTVVSSDNTTSIANPLTNYNVDTLYTKDKLQALLEEGGMSQTDAAAYMTTVDASITHFKVQNLTGTLGLSFYTVTTTETVGDAIWTGTVESVNKNPASTLQKLDSSKYSSYFTNGTAGYDYILLGTESALSSYKQDFVTNVFGVSAADYTDAVLKNDTVSFNTSGSIMYLKRSDSVSKDVDTSEVAPNYDASTNTMYYTTTKKKTIYTVPSANMTGNISDLKQLASGNLKGLLNTVYGISDEDADAYGSDGTYSIDKNGDITLTTGSHSIQLKFNAANGSLTTANGDSDGLVNMVFDQTIEGLEPFGYQKGSTDGDDVVAGHLTVDFSTVTNYNTNGSSTIKAVKGDKKSLNTGRAVGEMNGVTVSTDGQIYATYSNGQTKLLGQIASAEFANASGLSKEGDNLYASTLNSGEATIQDITTDGGYMNTGVLEMSNVDLSAQFTEMITTQRGFQANSRIITVSDTLLEELTNLKR